MWLELRNFRKRNWKGGDYLLNPIIHYDKRQPLDEITLGYELCDPLSIFETIHWLCRCVPSLSRAWQSSSHVLLHRWRRRRFRVPVKFRHCRLASAFLSLLSDSLHRAYHSVLSWISETTSVRLMIAAISSLATTGYSFRNIVLYFLLRCRDIFSRSSRCLCSLK
jgi:hypothetical protein